MPYLASSIASARVADTTPPFEDAYESWPNQPSHARDAILMMRPVLRGIMLLAAA